MKIIADENIPYVREAFSSLGEVKILSGRNIDAHSVKDADILLVRSITRIDKNLLDGSKVKFVGTATIGIEHIDITYLKKQNIAFASAPGSNANSVAEYVISALLVLVNKFNLDLSKKTIGIIGVGNVGSLVAKKAKCLGLNILLNDPPLAKKTNYPCYLKLEEIFEADIITLHTPLTYEGENKTYHLVDENFLAKMKPGSILINASRGKVVDEKALIKAIVNKHLLAVVLDVWETEPEINLELLKLVTIGTPHIAGYSFDGKVKGIFMIYQATCNFYNINKEWKPILPETKYPYLEIDTHHKSEEQIIYDLVLKIYDIRNDDKNLRSILKIQDTKSYFDMLRKEYPIRREFHNTKIKLVNNNTKLKRNLLNLEFKVL